MARRYRFLVKFYFDHTPVLATLMVTTSTKKSSWRGWLVQFSLICSKMRAKKERTTTMARHYRFLGEIIRPYTSVSDTDGHNIYEEVILAGMAFFVQ